MTFRIDPAMFIESEQLSGDVTEMTYNSFKAFLHALDANDDHRKFRDWWMQKASASGQLFQFDFANGPWNIPWELLLGLLLIEGTRSETAIVRCVGHPEETCESLTTKSLHTMIIKAYAPDLNLDKEIDDILEAWNGLEFQIREAVAQPIVVGADSDTIIAKLREVKPDVIWFSGHGSYDGTVHLRFSEKKEVTAAEFAEMFLKAQYCPTFAVFWACETVVGTTRNHSRPPNLFDTLHKIGLSAMVGMQSTVHDFAAIVMAANLFRGLSKGIPLEWAVAGARRWLYQNKDNEQLTMDWAVPVVWTARRPVAHLDWNQLERYRLQMQLLGTISIAEGQKGAGLEEEPPDAVSRTSAQDWLTFRATVVRGNPGSTEHRLFVLRILKGIQTISSRPVLLVDPGNGRFSKNEFQQWAASFLNVLGSDRGRLPEEFFVRMDILKNDAEIGWRRMCSLRELFIAIIDPPSASDEWFWKPLFDRTDPFAVLTEKEIPEYAKEFQVNHVVAGRSLDRTLLEDAWGNHPKLLLALSVLNIPVKVDTLKRTGFGKNAEILFNQYTDLFVGTFGGYVICADAKEMISEKADANSLHEAYVNCLEVIDIMDYKQRSYLLELKIDFLIKIDLLDDAVQEFSNLLAIYANNGQQISFIRAVSKYFQLRDGLETWVWYNIAATYLQLGDQVNAEMWLNRQAEDPLDIIHQLQLLAELRKNNGEIDEAENLLNDAIQKCEEVQSNCSLNDNYKQEVTNLYLKCRHDLARLIHWQKRLYKEAADQFENLIRIINTASLPTDHPNYRHLLAVTHRNLGECILFIKDKPIEERQREAESHFQSALSLERKFSPLSPLVAEIYYQLAKLESQRGLSIKEQSRLVQCIDSAEESQHGLMVAIAKNRLFWCSFSENRPSWNAVTDCWEILADSLRAHKRHGWALRTLIESNIRVAKQLINERADDARKHLQENLDLFRGNPNLRHGSDLDKIIKTLAGLQIISIVKKYGGQYWNLLDSEFVCAKERSIETESTNPEKAWERGT
jgi:tetratricopeptide (TPR) repeat protein